MQTTLEQIRTALASAYPLTVLVSLEEERLERLLGRFAAAAKPDPLPVTVWNCVDGFASDDTSDLTDPMDALAWIANEAPRGIYLLKDMGEYLEDRRLLRRLRDTAMKVRNSGRFLFLLKPDAMLPETLKPLSYVVVSMFPDSSELEQTVRTMVKSKDVSDGDVETLVGALKGMSLTEVEHLLRRLLDRHGEVNEEFFKLVLDEKEQVTRKEGILEFIPPDESLEQLGGLDQLKEWVHERSSLFTPEARKKDLPVPKGVLLRGISGCGKSLAVKVIAREWNLPLFRLDMNMVFAGVQGSAEWVFNRALEAGERGVVEREPADPVP